MAKLVLGGMPTDLDVERLLKEIGVPAVGELVPYTKLEEVLGLPRVKNRWRSVVVAWKKRLWNQHNLELKAVPNDGYRVLNNPERVGESFGRYKRGLRGIGRAGVLAARTADDTLSEEDKSRRDHLVKAVVAHRQHAATSARELSYPAPEVKRLAAAQG